MKVAFLLPLPLHLKPEHPGSNPSSIIVLWPWASPSSLQSSSFLNYKLAPIPIWASPNSSKGWRRWHVRKGFWSTPKLLPCTKYHKMQSLPLCSIQSRPAPSDMVATGCVANEHLWKLTLAVSINYVAGSVDLDGPQDMCTYKVNTKIQESNNKMSTSTRSRGVFNTVWVFSYCLTMAGIY